MQSSSFMRTLQFPSFPYTGLPFQSRRCQLPLHRIFPARDLVLSKKLTSCPATEVPQEISSSLSPEKKSSSVYTAIKRWGSISVFCGILAAHLQGWLPPALSAIGIGGWISVYSFSRKSLSISGCLAAWVVFTATFYSSQNCFAQLLAFFISSSLWTSFKEAKKESFVVNLKKGGQRNWIQVLCNGGLCTLFSLAFGISVSFQSISLIFKNSLSSQSVFFFGCVLGSLACCCGDTWASEIGILSKSQPRLITNLKPVPKGTNGGVSLLGLMASALGGMIIGLASLSLIILTNSKIGFQQVFYSQWPLVALGLTGGLVGSFTDSLLGATLQFSGMDQTVNKVVNRPGPDPTRVKKITGIDFLSNNQVNFFSSLLTALFIGFLSIQILN